MRTHVEPNDQLIAQVLQLGHFPIKKAAIHEVAEEIRVGGKDVFAYIS